MKKKPRPRTTRRPTVGTPQRQKLIDALVAVITPGVKHMLVLHDDGCPALAGRPSLCNCDFELKLLPDGVRR